MTHKPNSNKKRILPISSMKGLTPVLKCMLASILLSCLLPASSLYGQKIAVKSNLLYDLTTTFNIGGEIRCDDTHTLSLSVNYNPWNFGGNKKMKHFMLQPEYRKWFSGTFMGSYIGFQVHYALFNFGAGNRKQADCQQSVSRQSGRLRHLLRLSMDDQSAMESGSRTLTGICPPQLQTLRTTRRRRLHRKVPLQLLGPHADRNITRIFHSVNQLNHNIT